MSISESNQNFSKVARMVDEGLLDLALNSPFQLFAGEDLYEVHKNLKFGFLWAIFYFRI